MNPTLENVCRNLSAEYILLTDTDVISVNATTGAVRLMVEPDTEEMPFLSFKIMCAIGNKNFTMHGNISFLDIDDNAPTTQSGQKNEHKFYSLNPNDRRPLEFDVTVLDKDSADVNKLVAKIENDSKNLFKIQSSKMYDNFGNAGYFKTYFRATIASEDLSQHPFSQYNFTVVVEDKGLKLKEREVVFDVTVTKEKYQPVKFKDSYEVNISRNAAVSARILQLLVYPSDLTWFNISDWKKEKDWLSITHRSGIVYVQDPHLMTNMSTDQRIIKWWKKNDTHDISGTSILRINIIEGAEEDCSTSNWCSYYRTKEECIKNCGSGSITGLCSWRQEPLTIAVPNSNYSACSPDLETCPDGNCDELEQLDPSVCPLDCANEAYGSGKISRTKKGIEKAKGVCSCLRLERCGCFPQYPPAEIRLSKVNESVNLSHGIPPIEVSVIDPDKRFDSISEETSTPIEIIPVAGLLTDGSCGIGCIVLASVIPCGISVLIMLIFVAHKIRRGHISRLKADGSRISLSVVPSDYVQERSNSVMESRNSDSLSTGRSILDPKWEFPRNRLQFQTILGEGEFGKVVKAQALNICGVKGLTTVAVKMLKENGGVEEMQDLITEFTLLKDISHPNVIRLLGASTEKGGPFYLIVEYAEMGSLRSYLRKRRRKNNCCKYNASYAIPDLTIETPNREYYQFLCERARFEPSHCFFHKEQMSFAWQIAKGMAYLADMKLVHRDLATRNVLLNKRKVAKISDFGLSRDVYKGEAYLKKSKGRVPVKWLALESLEDQIYTTKSDVWSYGIVLWEIMMQGASPYPGVTPQRLYNLLKAGYRMTKPDFCPDELYLIMRQCWKKAPNERPSFRELVYKLDNLLQDTVEYMDFDSKHTQAEFFRRNSDVQLMPFYDPAVSSTSNIQYTTVLIENDEESSDKESTENIGLANLFRETGKEN